MKKVSIYFLYIMLLSIFTLGFISCETKGNDLNGETSCQKNEHFAEMIRDSILSVLEDSTKYGQNFYILFSAKDDEAIMVSDLDYMIGDIIYSWSKGEKAESPIVLDSSQTRAPQGNGWVKGGTFSSKLGALRLMNRLTEEIPEGHDVEIYLEHNDDGSYTIWYRIV